MDEDDDDANGGGEEDKKKASGSFAIIGFLKIQCVSTKPLNLLAHQKS